MLPECLSRPGLLRRRQHSAPVPAPGDGGDGRRIVRLEPVRDDPGGPHLQYDGVAGPGVPRPRPRAGLPGEQRVLERKPGTLHQRLPGGHQACDGASCVDTVACGAVCVSGAPAPEHPACTKPGVARLCAAGRAVVCGCGHAPEETVCPETCVTAPPAGQPEEGFCALDSKEEDRCPKNGGSGDFCDGDVRITCHLKYVTARSACPACSTIYVGVVECATQ